MPLVVVLVAGTNDPSNSDTLADAFIEGMKTVPGISFEKLRIRELALEHFELQHYDNVAVSEPDFVRLHALLVEAKGLVIASPIWNFSVPAHFKNLIDRIGTFALDSETHSKPQLQGVPVFLLFTGGAPILAWKALMSLTLMHVSEAFKYYGATVVGRHFEPRCMRGQGVFGVVVDSRPASLAAIQRKGRWFANVVQCYAGACRLPLRLEFKHRFFTWAFRIGNRIMYPVSSNQ